MEEANSHRLRLGPIARSTLKHVKVVLFHAQKIFRHNIGDRNEIRLNGKVAIYDIFPCKDNRYIALIGYYGRLDNPGSLTCLFESGEISKGIWIDDYPHTHEGEQVFICLFPVPEADRHAGITSVSLRPGNVDVLCELTIQLNDCTRKHRLSIGLIMKDEHRFLREWIEYYRIIGVEHFYIYDNRSLRKNKIRKLLNPYIEQGIVTLVDWDYPFAKNKKKDQKFCQRGQMHHCLYKYGQLSTWMLFIDVDEYVYPVDPKQTSLLPLLEKYEQSHEVAALQFKMIWFGNSGHKKIPEGLVIENYTHRATEVVQQGREKCCVKPDKVALLFIHDVKQYFEGSVKITVPPEQYRINHYYTTSAKRRGHRNDKFNEQVDTGMQRFVPLVRHHLDSQLYQKHTP